MAANYKCSNASQLRLVLTRRFHLHFWWVPTHVPEERKHFIVRSIIRDEEAQVSLVQHRSNTDQARTTAGYNGNVLPRVLAGLSLSVVFIVHVGNGLAEWLDAGGRSIFSRGDRDIDVRGPLEAAFDVILDLFDAII